MALSNLEILALVKSDPNYQSWTSKLTSEIFTEKGFQEIANTQELADFFGLSVRVTLQKIKRPNPRIPSLYGAIIEEYSNPNGGIFQRINTKLLKPTDPKYRDLVNGGSVDPFTVRKPETEERFYHQNFDFQNFLTIQDVELKKMFLAENGISEYIAGIMASLDESYSIQKYETLREVLRKILADETNTPLKASQKIQVPLINESSSREDQVQFIAEVQSLYDVMTSSVVGSEFNAKSYEHGMYPEDYVLLVRADVMNVLKNNLMANTFHNENYNFPFKVETVKGFGPVNAGVDYDPLTGEQVAATDTSDSLTNIQAVLIQKGAIFTTEQQPYQTRAIYNPAGLYTNFWASQPNSSFNYDACYDVVVFEV